MITVRNRELYRPMIHSDMSHRNTIRQMDTWKNYDRAGRVGGNNFQSFHSLTTFPNRCNNADRTSQLHNVFRSTTGNPPGSHYIITHIGHSTNTAPIHSRTEPLYFENCAQVNLKQGRNHMAGESSRNRFAISDLEHVREMFKRRISHRTKRKTIDLEAFVQEEESKLTTCKSRRSRLAPRPEHPQHTHHAIFPHSGRELEN